MKLDMALLQEVVSRLPDPVFILTESGRYAAVLGGTDPRFYHDGSHLVGRSLYEVMPQDKADWFVRQIRQTLEGQSLHTVEYGLSGMELEGTDVNGGPAGEIWFEGRIQPLNSVWEGERAVVWVARNITRRYELEARLRTMSETDELTGACNRRKLFSELKEHCREFRRYGHPTALLMIDIDHFKKINDCHGHILGDVVLQSVSRLCLGQLRDVDLFCRFGGEEFVALLPNTSLDHARLTAERLRKQIASEPVCESEDAADKVMVTVSIGVSELKLADKGLESILRRADKALYDAKRRGRNRVEVAPS